jgi:hypothetical protein
MNINDIENFSLDYAVKFHDELNQYLFDGDHMNPEVREQLIIIAQDFIDFMGITDLDVSDVVICGSNAAYTYTLHSDIDLHILVDMTKISNDDVYLELFNSKKNLYNMKHDITIHGFDVELYIQDSQQQVQSLGEYSILNDKWIKFPGKKSATIKHRDVEAKYRKLVEVSLLAIKTNDLELLDSLLETIKKYRKAGLDANGEFSTENLAYKALRSRGIVDQLYKHRDWLRSKELSIDEQINECSGYIPTEAERYDPRFRMALSVDVGPQTLKKSAQQLGSTIARDGRPPLLRSSGK